MSIKAIFVIYIVKSYIIVNFRISASSIPFSVALYSFTAWRDLSVFAISAASYALCLLIADLVACWGSTLCDIQTPAALRAAGVLFHVTANAKRLINSHTLTFPVVSWDTAAGISGCISSNNWNAEVRYFVMTAQPSLLLPLQIASTVLWTPAKWPSVNRFTLRSQGRWNIVSELYQVWGRIFWRFQFVNPLNAELNPIYYLLALLEAHHFLHVSRIRVKSLTLRLLMSYTYIYIYIYGATILDVSRSHTTTHHSR